MFFFNFKILIFWVVSGLKGQKMAQNDKNFCLLHLIFQETISFDLHLWYTYMYKSIISPGIFFIFFNILIFGIIRGKGSGKREKNGPKWQKILSVSLSISGTIRHMIVIFGTHVQNDEISRKIFHFSKFWFLGFLGSKRAKSDLNLPISVCFALYLQNCRSYHWDFYNDIYRCFSLYF